MHKYFLAQKLWVLALLVACPLFLKAEFFIINNYFIQVTLTGDQTFEVTETIDVTFSMQRHGIYRDIPLCYNTVDGKRNRILLSDIRVDGFKQKLTRSNCNLNIRIGDPDIYVDGEQRYVIHYTVDHGYLYEENHTEFYWNLIGERWPVSILKASFEVRLPNGVTVGEEDIKGFAGLAGTQQQNLTYEYNPSRNVITGESTVILNPGDALTVAVRLPKEAIVQPSKYEYAMRRYGLIGIPIALLLAAIGIFARFGWDKPVIKMVEFFPPEELTPSEAGAFVDDRSDNRDLIALIPYWGAQGLLRMEENEEKMWIGKKKDHELVKLAELPSDRPLYEQTIFDGLFGTRDRVSMKDLQNKFYTTMAVAKGQLRKEVMGKDLYTKGSLRWNKLFPWFIFGSFVGMIVAVVINKAFLIAGFLPLFIITIIFQQFMLRKNPEGRKLYQKVYGFKMFMQRAEQDRLKYLLEEDPEYFDKTLPYAVAYGLTKKWTQKFNGLFTEPPRWYAYHGTMHSNSFESFSSGFNSNINTVQSAFSSSPSSSGGGSSGGGGGGGGGGSW
jgi:uncharacterized membrane protein YgcG